MSATLSYSMWVAVIACLLISVAIPLTGRLAGRVAHVGRIIANCFIIAGIIGFIGTIFYSSYELSFLPQNFEWPAGYTTDSRTLPDGKHVVAIVPAGRLQVYDAHWKFIRGWRVNEHGSHFDLLDNTGDQIEILTTRLHEHLVYLLDGTMISCIPVQPERQNGVVVATEAHWVPTYWILLPFSHPFFSWVLAAAGFGVIAILGARTKRGSRANRMRSEGLPMKKTHE